MITTLSPDAADQLAMLRQDRPDRSAEMEQRWKNNVRELLELAERIANGQATLDPDEMLAAMQQVFGAEQAIGRHLGGYCVAVLVEELPLRFLRFRRAGRHYIASIEAGGDQLHARRQFKSACDDFVDWVARSVRRHEIDATSGILSLSGVDPWAEWPFRRQKAA